MNKKKLTGEEFAAGSEEPLNPFNDDVTVTFTDLFDLDDIQKLQDDFAKATGVASIIISVEGVPVTRPCNVTSFCEKIIRKTERGLAHCDGFDKLSGQLVTDDPTIRPCDSCGLWAAGARISAGGHHIANWLIGQVRDPLAPLDEISRYARALGADEDEVLEAYLQVPAMSKERFSDIAEMLFSLARQLSKSAAQHLQQAGYLHEYHRLLKELQESEETLRRITSSARDAIIMMDERGLVSFWNESAEAIFGYSKEEIIGKNLHICLAPEQFKDRYQAALTRFKQTGKGMNLDKTKELVAVKKDGSIFPVELSLASVTMRGKYHAIGIVRDITARKEAEAAEKKMAETLKHSQKMAAIGTLAGGIAHDFNNILSAILGFTDLLEMQIAPETKAAKYLANITDAGIRAKTLVKQILAFSRQVKKDVQPVVMKAIVKEVLSMMRASVPTNIEIRQDINSESMVLGDPSQIHQIIMNLCANAAHAMQEKGGVLDVQLTDMQHDPEISGQLLSLSSGQYIKLVVADNGHGIDSAIKEKIFDPFFTTKGPGEGTGMGLSVVHGIVSGCNGTILVESEVDSGTVFTVLLPVVETETVPSKGEQKKQNLHGSERILVVDDEKAIVEIVTQTLESYGYQATGMTNPEEALECFTADPRAFDMVISDLTMPQMTGDKLASRILAVRSDIPVIICTGYNSALDPQKADAIGVKKVLLKPVTRKQLTEAIREIFDGTAV